MSPVGAHPFKTNDISNADVTFSFNFCSHCAQLTIEWFISVGPLYRSLFLMGGKASTFKWCQIMMVGDEKSPLTAKATHPCYTEQETSNIFLRHQGCGWCYTVCCKTVILWLGCHGNSISWVSHVPVQHVIPVAAHNALRWGWDGMGVAPSSIPPFYVTPENKTNSYCILSVHDLMCFRLKWQGGGVSKWNKGFSFDQGWVHFHGNRLWQAVVLLSLL